MKYISAYDAQALVAANKDRVEAQQQEYIAQTSAKVLAEIFDSIKFEATAARRTAYFDNMVYNAFVSLPYINHPNSVMENIKFVLENHHFKVDTVHHDGKTEITGLRITW